MTREEAIKHGKEQLDFFAGEHLEFILMAIEALQAKTDGDLISRADVLETYSYLYWFDDDSTVVTKEEVSEVYERLQSLPSAEPKTGEWLEVEALPEVYDIKGVKTWGSEIQCDQCGFKHKAIEGHMAQYNYCPNCGADMRGETE